MKDREISDVPIDRWTEEEEEKIIEMKGKEVSIVELHRWKLICSRLTTIPSTKEDSSEHWAKRTKEMRCFSNEIDLTKSTNEFAPRSKRSSLINFGNVTGNIRRRVARISNTFNSVKLKRRRRRETMSNVDLHHRH